MKARHKDTGEIIDLAEEGIITHDGRRFCWHQVELIPEPIDKCTPSLPSNIDEAATKYAEGEYNKKDPSALPNRCRACYAPLKYAFKAGAEYGFDKGFESGKKDTIEKALKWLLEKIDVSTPIPTDETGKPIAAGYANYLKERQNVINRVESEFRKAMEE